VKTSTGGANDDIGTDGTNEFGELGKVALVEREKVEGKTFCLP